MPLFPLPYHPTWYSTIGQHVEEQVSDSTKYLFSLRGNLMVETDNTLKLKTCNHKDTHTLVTLHKHTYRYMKEMIGYNPKAEVTSNGTGGTV